MHGVIANFSQNASLEENQLEERLKGLRIDSGNIAKVVAANTGRSVEQITQAMLDRTILNPQEAQAWGLVHEIKVELFPAGAEVISIQYEERPR